MVISILSWVLVGLGVAAVGYQTFAILAVVVHKEKSRLRMRRPLAAGRPGVSVLKPVRGLDEGFAAALRSNVEQEYEEFEVLVGVHDGDDPAVAVVRELMRELPEGRLRLVVAKTQAPNAKVGILRDLAKQARHGVVVVNDADITVPRDYLRRVTAQLEEASLVTCLYRATATTAAGQWEAFGIATDFIPSTLVAPLVGVNEFGLGSTLCFRKADLEKIGGFKAVEEYIADDYQLAKRLCAAGRPTAVNEVVVGTTLSGPGWKEVWRHQVRWARTIRVSRGGGFLGLPVTHAGLWALANALVGNWPMALTLVLARVMMAVVGGFYLLGHWQALVGAVLAPVWDLWAFAVWAVALGGKTAWWRGRKITLRADGRIE